MARYEVYRDEFRVLLPVSSLAEAHALLPLAEAFASDRQGALVLLIVVTVPEGRPYSEAAAQASRSRQALNNLLNEYGRNRTQVKTLVRVAHQLWDGIWETVHEERIDLLVLGWRGGGLPQATIAAPDNPRLHAPPCDVALVRISEAFTPARWQHVQRVLLPVRSVEHNALGLRLAYVLAEVCDAEITLLHATGNNALHTGERVLAGFDTALNNLERVTRSLNVSQDVDQAILDEAQHHEVVVLGASAGDWTTPRVKRLLAETNVTLLLVKEAVRHQPPTSSKAPSSRTTHRPVSLVVDKWFAENTFHSREFANLEQLVQLKEKQGLTISLGLPALNEEATVGKVISTIKTALMDEVPLLDEIVLIDSGSVDYTREIAADLGIPVYIHQEILPQHGTYQGKGEALWKSLYVLQGDIIAWIDTDIKNIHPRFVYGILGPLLHHPRVQYVKGFYRRPLRQGAKVVAGGGGRVTELTARPLINLFFPELSGLIQPLSGEYAGRRAVLERLPFFTGYSVETGLLIDLLEQYGLQAIAQVDLLKRVHHNQPLPSLSKMSFAILQVVIRRLEDRHKIRLLEDFNKTMKLIRYRATRYYLETEEILERERPPMITIPEYREKRGLELVSLSATASTEREA